VLDRLMLLPHLLDRAPATSPLSKRLGRNFGVCPVQPARTPLAEWPAHKVVALHAGGAVEACSGYRDSLVTPLGSFFRRIFYHPLLDTLYRAWNDHRPVVLSPDVVWLTLTGGLARHLQVHASEFRDRLVSHAGQEVLTAQRDDFVAGSPDNDWPAVFAELSEAVRAVIGSAHELIVAEFSTTGPVERAASEVMLMSALRPYFASRVSSRCGIPSITLEGTVADWEMVLQRASGWERFGLGWWLDHLLPVLEQLVAAAKGQVDLSFWQSIFQSSLLCGREHVSGWVCNLFPYLADEGRIEANVSFAGGALHVFGGGLGRVPFAWEYGPRRRRRELEFLGGLVGIRQQRDTLSLRPEIGWAVRHR
jgi:hypothetical protein